MARFLLTSWSFGTHVDVFRAVGHSLKHSGHDVACYSAERERTAFAEAGIDVLPFHELSQDLADALVEGVLKNRRRPRKLWSYWRQFLLGTIPAQLNDIHAVLDAYRPDVLVCDMAMWGPILVTHELRKLPVAVLSHVGFCLHPGPEGPVPGRAMPPRRTVAARVLEKLVNTFSTFAAEDARKESDRLRSRYGLRPRDLRMTELYAQMPLYLLPGTPSFDYGRHDLPASVHYIGPCLWPPPPPPSYRAAASRQRPHIVVDEGSLYSDDAVLPVAALAAFAGAPIDVTIIAGKGRDLNRVSWPKPGPNIHVLPWQPVQQVLPGADILLTNGNTESALSALREGIPLVVVPSILDQAEVALRVAESGAGLRLREGACTPGSLRRATETVLRETTFRQSAERLQRECVQFPGPPEAVRLLETLLGRAAACT